MTAPPTTASNGTPSPGSRRNALSGMARVQEAQA